MTPSRLLALSPPASLGIRSKRVPRCRRLRCASTPSSKLPSARRYHSTSHVPPSWFCTTATGSSAHQLPGLLHPGTGSRFAAFPVRRPPLDTTRDPKVPARTYGRPKPSPLRSSHPSKKSSRLQPDDASPRPVAPSPLDLRLRSRTCLARLRRPSTSRPCSAVGSVAPPTVASRMRPLLPWALFPSRVRADPTDARPGASPHLAITCLDRRSTTPSPVPPRARIAAPRWFELSPACKALGASLHRFRPRCLQQGPPARSLSDTVRLNG